ncbi:MAG: tryptophan--tRNA ligase [Acidobacteria bacterium]|nr:MAG: tryptophan--tRNA ligase [Acidobacteriota bacterium]PIE89053.1 MAG: tryptophan--tRNA ligase [Acidobacteriota bacterium]
MKKRILSGIQPSGKLHIGNYLGAIKQHLDAQDQQKADRFYFIANYHSLTSIQDRDVLKEHTLDVARTYLALGLDPEKSLLFLQSDVPEVCELSWVLSTLASMGLLQRCHSYKDKVARGLTPNHGLFAYPVLMAADIIIYDSHIVPVGADQKQHVEVTRDLAIKFNHVFGDTLVVPEPAIKKEVAVIPGIDGQKMSKSYQNTIELFASKKALKKQIMAIVTDSKGLDEPKDPESCHVFKLFKFFGSREEIQAMAEKYRAGGYGYGHAKLELLGKINDIIGPHREKYEYLKKHEDEVMDVLRTCGRKARAVASETMRRVREATGLVTS